MCWSASLTSIFWRGSVRALPNHNQKYERISDKMSFNNLKSVSALVRLKVVSVPDQLWDEASFVEQRFLLHTRQKALSSWCSRWGIPSQWPITFKSGDGCTPHRQGSGKCAHYGILFLFSFSFSFFVPPLRCSGIETLPLAASPVGDTC